MNTSSPLRIILNSCILVFCFHALAFTQASDKVKSVAAGEAKEGEPVTVRIELLQSANITQVVLVYRPSGIDQYKEIEMVVSGASASVTIPASDVKAFDIEYYFKLIMPDTTETYPRENPEAQALRIVIRPVDEKDKAIIFLSPEPGTSVTIEDLLVSISLVRAPSPVNKAATKLYIDDRDVTQFAVISEDLIVLSPENISPPLENGAHSVKVELFDIEGNVYHTSSTSFTQVSLREQLKASVWKYNVSTQLEARNENIQSVSTPYNRGQLVASAEYGVLKVNGRVYVTNEDKAERQPQNRYFIEAGIPWLRVGYGDAYPVFPNLIMNGKRMRGLTSNLALGFFNVDFAIGKTIRKVDGELLRTFDLTKLDSVRSDSSRPNATGNFGPTPGSTQIWGEYRYGTYSRDITVLRPSFGSGENFQWGFSYVKAKDDIGSINYGIKPQENLVVGTDILIAADNHNFEFTAQGGASVYNKDIAPGNLRDSQIDSLFTNDADSTKKRQDLKDIRDKISQFITVNQNLVPLSADKLTSILAYEGAIVLNYFNNYFKGGYIFRGSEYNSFGQTFLRKDIQGFNLYDRVRIAQNQFFLSLGYERLQDNTDGSKTATTTFTNFNSTVSYFPRMNFPNITIGYTKNQSTNGLAVITAADTVGQPQKARQFTSAIEDINNRVFVQLGYDFTAGLRHTANLNFNTSMKDDQSFRNADSKNTTVGASLTTTWKIPLLTTVGISINTNQIPTFDQAAKVYTLSDFNYTNLILSGRYRMFQNKLVLSAGLIPIFGDFKRTTFDVAAEYLIVKNLIASAQLTVLQNVDVSTDVISSVILRYNL
jgi:hypothetical protein